MLVAARSQTNSAAEKADRAGRASTQPQSVHVVKAAAAAGMWGGSPRLGRATASAYKLGFRWMFDRASGLNIAPRQQMPLLSCGAAGRLPPPPQPTSW